MVMKNGNGIWEYGKGFFVHEMIEISWEFECMDWDLGLAR
jgi:hypothetical protein